MSKKKLIETHGKVSSTLPSTLEQFWGATDFSSRYGTLDRAVYAAKVDDMTRSDLETEARRYDVFICEDTKRLRRLLVDKFEAFVASINKPEDIKHLPINKKLQAAALQILREGR